MLVINGKYYKYAILSRNEAEEFKAWIPYILISITDPNEPKVTLRYNNNRLDTLYLFFHDVSSPHPYYEFRNLIPFGIQQAKKIIDFVNKYKNKAKLIACNCEAGISRSAGVISAISLILEGKEPDSITKYLLPNTYVKSLILRVYYKTENYDYER